MVAPAFPVKGLSVYVFTQLLFLWFPSCTYINKVKKFLEKTPVYYQETSKKANKYVINRLTVIRMIKCFYTIIVYKIILIFLKSALLEPKFMLKS